MTTPSLPGSVSIGTDPDSLALTCATRLAHFARYQFDPKSDESLRVADLLWRATRMAMDAERGAL